MSAETPNTDTQTQTSPTSDTTQTSPKVVVAGKEIIKRLELPTEGAYVVLLTNPKADILTKLAAEGVEVRTKNLIPYLIREWNYADENNKVLEITQENVDKAFSVQDTAAVLRFVGLDAFLDAKKNNS